MGIVGREHQAGRQDDKTDGGEGKATTKKSKAGGEGGKGKEIVMISPLGSVHQTSHHRLTGTASGRAFMDVADI